MGPGGHLQPCMQARAGLSPTPQAEEAATVPSGCRLLSAALGPASHMPSGPAGMTRRWERRRPTLTLSLSVSSLQAETTPPEVTAQPGRPRPREGRPKAWACHPAESRALPWAWGLS